MQQYTFGYSKTAQNLVTELKKDQNKHLIKHVNRILTSCNDNNFIIARLDLKFFVKNKIELLLMNKNHYLEIAKNKLHNKSDNDFVYSATCYLITTSYRKYYHRILSLEKEAK